MLAVIDDFERALAADGAADAQAYRSGVELIHRQLLEVLKKRGVTRGGDASASAFDPHLHQAVAYEESAGRRATARVDRRAAPRLSARRAAAAPGAGAGREGIVSARATTTRCSGVARDAGDADIKKAYRKLALKHHPDRNAGDAGAEEQFKEAAEAYAVLADPDKRARYDRFGHAAVAGGGQGFDPTVFTGFEDILGGLGDIFGFGDVFGGGRRRNGPQRGADLRYDLEITFAAVGQRRRDRRSRSRGTRPAPPAAAAARRRLVADARAAQCRGTGQLRYQQGFFTMARTCGTCRGTGQVITKPCADCRGEGQIEQQRKLTVKIPAGIASGQRLRLQGEGEAGARGGPAGDLYVVIFVQDDERFTRDGNDLHHQADVPFTTLALGGEIAVPGIDGTHAVKVPEGTATGTTFRVRGKGMPDVSGRGKGDLLVTVRGTTPTASDPRSAPAARGVRRHAPTPESSRRRRQGPVRQGEGHLWLSRGAGPR